MKRRELEKEIDYVIAKSILTRGFGTEMPLEIRRLVGKKPLVRVLTVENLRTILPLYRYGTKNFDLSLEDVTFHKGRRKSKWYGLEVEAIKGPLKDLVKIGDFLKENFKIRVSNVSKLELGLKLMR